MKIYDFTVNKSSGEALDLTDFKNKTLLIVNTATKCGLAPQFEELELLHQKYKDKGLVIIGFPSNQFLNQEPESNESMADTCKINFGVTFQLTEKIKVNGKDTHPIFKYLKNELKGTLSGRIKWNFTKFLITPDGKPYKRYAPSVKPNQIENDIQSLLNLN
jgi:glutathione peroxidase